MRYEIGESSFNKVGKPNVWTIIDTATTKQIDGCAAFTTEIVCDCYSVNNAITVRDALNAVCLVEEQSPPPADQWELTDEQIAEAKLQPPFVINRIKAFCDYARGLEIKSNNGTINESDSVLLSNIKRDIAKY
jgi:hypothetical protein